MISARVIEYMMLMNKTSRIEVDLLTGLCGDMETCDWTQHNLRNIGSVHNA